MKQLLIGVFAALVVSCAGGTETGNPATLKGFTASGCKSRAPEPGQQALVLASDAEGLQCIEWSHDAAGSLTLRLLNFPEPCGDKYLGTSSVTKAGELELSVYKDSCGVDRCGLCVFDFDFELTGVDTAHPLDLRTGSAICQSAATSWDDGVTLAVDQADTGVMCRYLERSAVEQYGRGRGTCGERNMPCGDCAGLDTQSCSDGLTCSAVGDADSRCLAACTSDDDCAGGLMTCQDGLCQSKADF
ncbi:MAG TPA: hypothetical protein VNG33_20580 [Polyangiaceae bacterium]|nr:hypothetical protein [Polyangiaceae bacterium]